MSDPATDDWEAPRRLPIPSGMPELHLEAYDGPLDLLLELARAGKVDLAKISISDLAAQFVAAVEAAIEGRRVPLSTLGDWVVAAATLLSLRSRLLLPADTPEKQEAEREAGDIRRRLEERAVMQALAGWLERRRQLGRDVFARGMAETVVAGPPAADITELLRACLKVLQVQRQPGRALVAPLPLWRVADAERRIREVVISGNRAAGLADLLPAALMAKGSTTQRSAALASTFVAGLELARTGDLEVDQEAPWAEVRLHPPAPPWAGGRAAPRPAP